MNSYEHDDEGLAIHAAKCALAIIAFIACVVLAMTVIADRKDVRGHEANRPRWEIAKSEPGHDSGFGYYQRRSERGK